MTKVKSLFAFVDPKDPFMASEIAGEELPGPVLSMMSAKPFGNLFLFHTPHTRENALATIKEVSSRYPECQISVHELPVSDPKDYSSIMGNLVRMVRELTKGQAAHAAEQYICVSSGTAEMRTAWFLLTTLGVVEAKLLQIGTPSRPLSGPINVKEVQLRAGDWATMRDLAMPLEYFVGLKPPGSPPPTLGKSPRRKLVGHTAKTHPIEERRDPMSTVLTGIELTPDQIEALSRKRETAPDEVVEGAPAKATIEPEKLSVPGLDDALQELGIYVGSAVLRHAAERAAIAAGSDLPVLLSGETGTGKEQFARLIHGMSTRSSRELVAINCAAIPESIAEDYLFGHMKGAFSGAQSDKKGTFESADQSTLFLDEIAELTLEVQAKLLRVIQDGVICRLGSTATRKVDVRIIAASNRDLRHQVSTGRFREDLYFRLEVVQIKLPALRERRNEIPELALALLKRINLGRHRPRQLTPDALMRLERCDWPGNVRQLSNVLQRSVLYSRGDVIEADGLIITENTTPKEPFTTLPEPQQGFRLDEYLAQIRKQLFVRALAASNGNQTEAAQRLGVSKQAVSKFLAGQDDNLN